MFGFRVAAAANASDVAALVTLADLDLLRARHHAAILGGYEIPASLDILRHGGSAGALRGVSSVEDAWAVRHTPTRGTARIVDTADGPPAATSLTDVCHRTGITVPQSLRAPEPPPADHDDPCGPLASIAVTRGLLIALAAGRQASRYTWDGTLDLTTLIIANAWDFMPELGGPRDMTAVAEAAGDGGRGS